MRAVRIVVLAGVSAFLGCSSGQPMEESPDASVDAPTTSSQAATPVPSPTVNAGSAALAKGGVLDVVKSFGPWTWAIDADGKLEPKSGAFQLTKIGVGRDPTVLRKAGAWTTIGGADL